MPDYIKEEFRYIFKVFIPVFLMLGFAYLLVSSTGVMSFLPFFLIGIAGAILSVAVFGPKMKLSSVFFLLSSFIWYLAFIL